jgi:dienelactone hydrolase
MAGFEVTTEAIFENMIRSSVAVLWVCAGVCGAQHFDYDRTAPLDVQESATHHRAGFTMREISYASPRGGRVPASLVIPAGAGPFPAILFGHWMKPGSPLMNRGEFLEETTLLARAGAISILIDAPLVRPGAVEDKAPLSGQDGAVTEQQVVDFRRAIDLLLSRDDVDPKRIAYVGHSFDAKVGAILSGVEKRISTFVLMAGSCGDAYYVFQSGAPGTAEMRKQVGDAKLREYFARYAWVDPEQYVGHSSPAAVFLQFASQDGPASYAQHCEDIFGEPKRMQIYDASHALNAEARRDRVLWLVKRLRLKSVDQDELAKIPELK